MMDLHTRSFVSFLLVILLVRSGYAATDYFLNPPYPGAADDFQFNPTYTIGSKIDLWWKTTYPSINLVLWQVSASEAGADGVYPSQTFFNNHAPIETMQWEVDVSKFNTLGGTVFFFGVYNAAFTNSTFSCHYFNVTSSGATTTQNVVTALVPSSGAVTATITPEVAYTNGALLAYSTPTSAATTKSTSTSTSTSTNTSKHHSGLSTGAKIGIGVGVGIGVAGMLAGMGWFLYRRNKRPSGSSKAPDLDPSNNSEYYGSPNPKYSSTYAYQYAPLNDNTTAVEMDSHRPLSELPDSRKPGELAGSDYDR